MYIYLFIYLLLFILCIRYIFYNIKRKIRISLIIPTDYQDFIDCSKIIYYNSNISCYYSYEIILIVSNIKNKNKIEIEEKKKYLLKSCNKLKIYLFKDKRNAAYNRNYGYSVSKGDYISYFDSDDIISKYRMIYLNKLLDIKNDFSLLLHKFNQRLSKFDKIKPDLSNPLKYIINISSENIKKSYDKYSYIDPPNHRWCCKYIINKAIFHNGWLTIKRNIMKRMKYNEKYDYGEDSEFNSRLIMNRYKIILIDLQLGSYKGSSRYCNDWFKMFYEYF